MTVKYSLVILICLGAQYLTSQTDWIYHEYQDDEYLPLDPKKKRTTKAFQITAENFFCTQVNIDGDGLNIIGDAANEPSIAINQLDPSQIIIGWRQFDNINSGFRQAGQAYSIDGGFSWTNPQVIDPGEFRSDPVLASDDEGNFYYNSLRLIDNDIVTDVYKTNKIGEWDEGTYAFGGDKQWMAVGRSPSNKQHVIAAWQASFSICEGSLSRSSNGGESFDPCEDSGFDRFLGTMEIGLDGKLYIAGWHQDDINLRVSNGSDDSIVWETVTSIPIGGEFTAGTGPNPQGLLGQVNVATDISTSSEGEFVYVLATVKPHVGADPSDIMFARSQNGGKTFSAPTKINTDISSTNTQWFGTMSVAPNGRIDVIWLDTRDNAGTLLSSLYYSFSIDNGVTWSDNQKLTDSFDPHIGWPQQEKMGDYFDMESSNDGAHLAWTATFSGGQDVYYGFITPAELTTSTTDETALNTLIDLEILPNPSMGDPTIKLISKLPLDLIILLYDINGRLVGQSKKSSQGIHEQSLSQWIPNWNTNSKGLYFIKVQSTNHGSLVRQIIKL